jgi:hypothetical protein
MTPGGWKIIECNCFNADGIRAGDGARRRGRPRPDSFDLASFRQNRAQAAILSFAKSPDIILSIDFMYLFRHDFGGTKPSQKNPLKVDASTR